MPPGMNLIELLLVAAAAGAAFAIVLAMSRNKG
jgi:hypothetical protein